ncbi:MAG: formylglycine-generating enzyme family protein [Planctomycetota bacterium]|nr:formylglycine-generating enzyme family protein [Planctomycetota bacterium]
MVAKNPDDRIPQMAEVIRLLEEVAREYETGVGDMPSSGSPQNKEGNLRIPIVFDGGTDIATSEKTKWRKGPKPLPVTVRLPSSAHNPSAMGMIARLRRYRMALAGVAFCAVVGYAIVQFSGNSKTTTELSGIAPKHDDIIESAAGDLTTENDQARPLSLLPTAITSDSILEAQAVWAKRLGQPVRDRSVAGFVFVLIPPGKLELDPQTSHASDAKSMEFSTIEQIQRTDTIAISQPFYCSAYEVSRRQFFEVLGFDPSTSLDLVQKETKLSRPVETVSWLDAVRFCNALSEKSGLPPYYGIGESSVTIAGGNGIRLPTEDEWDYACRAGSTTQFSFGERDDDLIEYGWFATNSMNQTQPVGTKQPNRLGLYDMHGNVWEWCEDAAVLRAEAEFDTNRRIVRGGSWTHDADGCGSASRQHYGEGDSGPNGGFRVVRTIESPGK